jgi:hypothetical protein
LLRVLADADPRQKGVRSGETHFHIHTNINVMALQAAAHRAVQPAPTAVAKLAGIPGARRR